MSKKAIIGWIVLAGVLLWLPQYAEGFWLQTGLFAMSAAIGAIGLTLLVGVTGQLSLAHAFFIGIGAYGYSYLAGPGKGPGTALSAPAGLGWPRCETGEPGDEHFEDEITRPVELTLQSEVRLG